MAAIAAGRSLLRSTTLRHASTSFAAGAARRRRRLCLPTLVPRRLLRSPVEMSSCVESLMPIHSATASALMTSLLSASCCSRGWVPDGKEP